MMKILMNWIVIWLVVVEVTILINIIICEIYIKNNIFNAGISEIVTLTSVISYSETVNDLSLRICDSNGLCCDTGYLSLQLELYHDYAYDTFQVIQSL